jgi:hypothetical protein
VSGAFRVCDFLGEGTETLVVRPMSDVSFLQWLATEEDRAREEAARRAQRVAQAVPADVVEVAVGDPDPLVAVEDALRRFSADELVIVRRPDEEATWLERDALRAFDRFGVRVVHVVDDDARDSARRLRKVESRRAEKVAAFTHELVEGESLRAWLLAHAAVLLSIAGAFAVVLVLVVIAYVAAR